MHTLTTHLRPHLDDICAMWLLKRYLPDAKHAKLDFIATNANGGDVVADPGIVYLGVGRGEFDEHKGDHGQCTTSLVFADLVNRVAFEPQERRALELLVDWVLQEDLGTLMTTPYHRFAVPAIIEGYFDTHERDSHMATEFGFQMLDALIAVQRSEAALELDWARRQEFQTPWGKGVAVTTNVRGIDAYAYARKFALVVLVNKNGTYHGIRASALSEVDLSEAHRKLVSVEPKAGWFLHHSKKMLLCGGDHAPDVEGSKMEIDQLVKLVSA